MSESNASHPSRVRFAWFFDWWRREWQRTRQRWRRHVVILLLLLAALLIVRGALSLWLGHRLNVETARLEKLYGRLDPATLAPPRVPPGENRARAMRAAASLLDVEGNRLGTLNAFPPLSVQSSPQVMENLRRLVEENQLAIQVAEQGRRRPKSNWEIDYAHDDANFPRLLDVRRLGSVLAASCRIEVDAGRADEAAEAALAGLAEAASLRQEPPLIIQLIRIAVARQQFGCLHDLLKRGEPSAAQLAELASALLETRASDPIHTALVGELKYANERFVRMERGSLVNWIVRPLVRYLRLRYLRQMGRILDSTSVAPFARSPSQVNAWLRNRHPKWWQMFQRFDEMFLAGLRQADENGSEYQSLLNAADLAIALRRFRIDRGVYPDTLAELAPHYLTGIPPDPFTGRPPKYARQGTGFELRVQRAKPGVRGALDQQPFEWTVPR